MPSSPAITAYAARATEYAEKLGSIESVPAEYRPLISDWAGSCTSTILDVGCGPGHITDYLRRQGRDIEGLDPVPEFVSIAQSRFPRTRFRVAAAEDLGCDTGGIGGILAWYSLIHTDPEEIDHPLKECARALRPGGGLLVGFFEWPQLSSFDHKVVTAYRWPVNELAARIEHAGFTIESTAATRDPGTRPHAVIRAQRE
ncbi:class I SAM-dependent methyltransferase [Nesterenkonia muleiensis]|uniref:class I SAM-dependent methyltransferase n=1 Tax=Nesterenkonia muleiensis TaxID=2282648 RepID=UPI000E71178B|nr:class I SAM-dependent methyltransferase [Nesterenkonia muleiensis]